MVKSSFGLNPGAKSISFSDFSLMYNSLDICPASKDDIAEAHLANRERLIKEGKVKL